MAKPPAKQTRKWKRTAKKDCQNLKLWAEGAREDILKPHIAGYMDTLEHGWRLERDYLEIVCNKFHVHISWRLEDHEEPEGGLSEWDEFALLVLEVLSSEDKAAKLARCDVLNALKYRARRLRRPVRMDRSQDPWGILLAKLAGINSPPKARQAFQQYMHESYEAEIRPTVKAQWEATCLEGNRMTLKSKKGPDAPFRTKVAWDLFAELSSEAQQGLRSHTQEEAKEARDEYTL
ncbi:hypothetical protein B0H17DRAFT_1207900 [Mycena rosella]|uniref:Uncharacterized protein n=1 Tax=Mycena rosella TaxID=1033263 RepID=A0AAD7G7J4_MYCRO|nr:hypothetical protein B0H17DRAFT_1207900 [Mycena rosella]